MIHDRRKTDVRPAHRRLAQYQTRLARSDNAHSLFGLRYIFIYIGPTVYSRHIYI